MESEISCWRARTVASREGNLVKNVLFFLLYLIALANNKKLHEKKEGKVEAWTVRRFVKLVYLARKSRVKKVFEEEERAGKE